MRPLSAAPRGFTSQPLRRSDPPGWRQRTAAAEQCGGGRRRRCDWRRCVVGVACALLAARGARVTLIDERPALSYTSALSTECYRNWWGADPTMTAFMDRTST